MAGQEGDSTTFSIEGGAGSISYTLGEISAVGGKLGRLAQFMVPLVDRMQAEWFWLDGAAAGSAHNPQDVLEALRNAVWLARRVQDDTAALALKTGQASERYADAESAAAARVAQANKVDALLKGLNNWRLGPFAAWGVAADLSAVARDQEKGLRDQVEKILNGGGAYATGMMGPGFAALYLLSQLRRRVEAGSGKVPAFALRKAFDSTGLAYPGHMSVRQLPAREWDARDPFLPAGHASAAAGDGEPWTVRVSIEGMLSGSNDAYKYPPGSIGVVRVERPDGTNVWLVHLPGTEDWSTVDSTNPFDMEGNLEGLTAAQREKFGQQQVLVQELMKEALRASGARPGEEVLLTGHSGGGIHAAAAAGDPAFLAEVNVKMIVIAGAPARNSNVSKGVSVLDLQNEDDIVTAVDLGPPPPAPNWVTATSHRRPPMEGTGVGEVLEGAHSLDNYLRDAAVLDRSEDPAVLETRERLRVLLGAGVVGAALPGAKWVYQGRDVPDNPRKPKPGRAGSGTGAEAGSGTGSGTGKDRYKRGAR